MLTKNVVRNTKTHVENRFLTGLGSIVLNTATSVVSIYYRYQCKSRCLDVGLTLSYQSHNDSDHQLYHVLRIARKIMLLTIFRIKFWFGSNSVQLHYKKTYTPNCEFFLHVTDILCWGVKWNVIIFLDSRRKRNNRFRDWQGIETIRTRSVCVVCL